MSSTRKFQRRWHREHGSTLSWGLMMLFLRRRLRERRRSTA